MKGATIYRHLGRNGECVSATGLGGWHLALPNVDDGQSIRIARTRTFRPFSEAERSALLARTADAAAHGDYESFKTRSIFDATAQNPEWLEEEPERISKFMPA